MASESRETSVLVSYFQQAHAKIVALRRLDDQIASLVVQHQQMQQEVRDIQGRINEEFERAIKFNQAPSKLALLQSQEAEQDADDEAEELPARERLPVRRTVGALAVDGDDADD